MIHKCILNQGISLPWFTSTLHHTPCICSLFQYCNNDHKTRIVIQEHHAIDDTGRISIINIIAACSRMLKIERRLRGMACNEDS